MCNYKPNERNNKMSTRCNIKLIEKDQIIWLYHHHDGYPRYLGAFLLTKYNDTFKDKNKYIDAFDLANELIKDKDDDEFELTNGIHGDIEYLYEIDIDKREIRCFEIGYEKQGNDWQQMVGAQINLVAEACAWKVTRSDKDGRSTWYLSSKENTLKDDDGNTMHFDTPEAAQQKALDIMLEDFKKNLDDDE